MLVEFLTAIKRINGVLKSPRWFMNDDKEQYFNSSKSVFGAEGTIKLLCAWHVDNTQRNALEQHISTKEMQLEVYHNLRVLLMESKEFAFGVLLQQLLVQ